MKNKVEDESNTLTARRTSRPSIAGGGKFSKSTAIDKFSKSTAIDFACVKSVYEKNILGYRKSYKAGEVIFL